MKCIVFIAFSFTRIIATLILFVNHSQPVCMCACVCVCSHFSSPKCGPYSLRLRCVRDCSFFSVQLFKYPSNQRFFHTRSQANECWPLDVTTDNKWFTDLHPGWSPPLTWGQAHSCTRISLRTLASHSNYIIIGLLHRWAFTLELICEGLISWIWN